MDMKKNSIFQCATCALLSATALLAPLGASAQSSKSGADDWKFRASIYAWLPSLEVKSNFSVPPAIVNAGLTTGGNAEVDGGDILKAMESVFMGTFEARKGRWGGFTDLITLNLGQTKTGSKHFTIGGRLLPTVPGDAALTADFSLKGAVWTLAGQYAAIDEPGHNLNIVAGARYLTLDQKLNWSFSGNVGPIALPLRTGTMTSDGSVTDFVVGVRGQAKLGDGRWFVPYYLDVGTGQSNSTYQGLIGLGYAFDWGEITAAYRVLDYNLPDSKFVSDLRFNGGMIGLGFRW
ncbi:hypothetical protein DFR35_2116 [Sulfurisoma sediminicola]|uniref:Outer membrane protein beta-barrel domain-containing protein n=2 Tax=Sulfurisoma sediminicola TaxID=1381557 RepID=A0A497XAT1_9PROT|nr:hypothetical protein DFR35_2116 [Sulfurisoma sediminicola]